VDDKNNIKIVGNTYRIIGNFGVHPSKTDPVDESLSFPSFEDVSCSFILLETAFLIHAGIDGQFIFINEFIAETGYGNMGELCCFSQMNSIRTVSAMFPMITGSV